LTRRLLYTYKMAIFNEDYNKGAIEFFQFVLSGFLALQQKNNPGSKDFLFYAAIFVTLWAKKNWFNNKYNDVAFLNLGVGFSLYMAWNAEVSAFDNSSGNVLKWTLFVLFALQWIIYHVLRLTKKD